MTVEDYKDWYYEKFGFYPSETLIEKFKELQKPKEVVVDNKSVRRGK